MKRNLTIEIIDLIKIPAPFCYLPRWDVDELITGWNGAQHLWEYRGARFDMECPAGV